MATPNPLPVEMFGRWVRDNQVPTDVPVVGGGGHRPFNTIETGTYYPETGPVRPAIVIGRTRGRDVLTVAEVIAFIEANPLPSDGVFVPVLVEHMRDGGYQPFRDLGESSYHAPDGQERPALMLQHRYG